MTRPLLEASLNGARRPGEHPALPVTPAELARDVAAVEDAGAGAVHLHVKDADGADTLGAAPTTAVLDAVLLHGEGTSCWPAVRLAADRGLATRIGFEDVLHLPDGSTPAGNGELVLAALSIQRPGDVDSAARHAH